MGTGSCALVEGRRGGLTDSMHTGKLLGVEGRAKADLLHVGAQWVALLRVTGCKNSFFFVFFFHHRMQKVDSSPLQDDTEGMAKSAGLFAGELELLLVLV